MTQTIDEQEITDIVIPQQQDAVNKEFEQDIYKKVIRAKEIGRFAAVRPLFAIGKVIVDVGRFNAQNKLDSSSICYLDVVKFGTYLRAVTENRAAKLYFPDKFNMVDTEEGITIFGGGKIDGRPISRIFKSHHWPLGEGKYDSSAFQWKVGHFEATEAGTGILKPDMSKPISVDSIKISRIEIAEISYVLDLAIGAYAAQNPRWYHLKRD